MSLTKASFSMIEGTPLNVADYGAVGNGTTDDTTAIQAAIDALANEGALYFEPGKTYRTTATLIFPPTLRGIQVIGNNAIIFADHNGDGIDITAQNENYSRHAFFNLTIKGPNVAFPANPSQLAGTSTGAALKIGYDDTSNTPAGYLLRFYNCNFQQFLNGVYMQAVLLSQFESCFFGFNADSGVYVDGGQTNANNFIGCGFRQNRQFGVYSSGRTGGALTDATTNTFYGCVMETNIPYDLSAGGYPATFDGTKGFGVKIWNSYDWLFDGCYFENHNYSVMLSGSSDDNQFRNCRFDGGGGGSPVQLRPGGIYFDGGTLNNNVFQSCKLLSESSTVPNVEWDTPATCLYNQFIDNIGFVFDVDNIGARSLIRNGRKTQGTGNGGQNIGLIQLPYQGYIENPGEGTTPGTITGIGTATATLNIFGYGEVQFGNQITGATTITSIDGQQPGQFIVLRNYQTAHNVTLKSGASGTDNIVLTGFADVVFNAFGQQLVLYVTTGLGGNRCYEVGRNF